MTTAWAVWARQVSTLRERDPLMIVETQIALCKTLDQAVSEALKIITSQAREDAIPQGECMAVFVRRSSLLIGFGP